MSAEEYFPLSMVGTEEEWDEMMEMEREEDYSLDYPDEDTDEEYY